MYSLDFGDDFFMGDGSVDIYDMPTSDRPTNVFQAIISLDRETKIGIARDVLGSSDPEITIETEIFPFEVLDKVRETNSCDDLSSPVTVYIDKDRFYDVTVYEEGGPDKPYFVTHDDY